MQPTACPEPKGRKPWVRFRGCTPYSGALVRAIAALELYSTDELSWTVQEKSQKLDEGVPRASDWRSRLELLESASPVAFADIRTYMICMPGSNRRCGGRSEPISETTVLFTVY